MTLGSWFALMAPDEGKLGRIPWKAPGLKAVQREGPFLPSPSPATKQRSLPAPGPQTPILLWAGTCLGAEVPTMRVSASLSALDRLRALGERAVSA